jgi:hypothetical protein
LTGIKLPVPQRRYKTPIRGGAMMSDDAKKSAGKGHKLGADRHDPAQKPAREAGQHKTTKDVREDRGIRKHKLGKHKN